MDKDDKRNARHFKNYLEYAPKIVLPLTLHSLWKPLTKNDKIKLEQKTEKLLAPSRPTLSTVWSWTDRTEVRTEPNLQVLGLVLDEGEPDPYLQVQGPTLSGPDLRVEPGSDLVRT